MKQHRHFPVLASLGLCVTAHPGISQDQSAAPLPEGVRAVWDRNRAHRDGLYLDAPQQWDDPYRFFCW